MVATDELDEAIIALLQEDGRRGNRDIARVLSVSEGTVRNRIKRLEDLGAIRIGVVMTREALELPAAAYVRLAVAPRFVRAVAEAAAELDEVPFVGITIGRFSITILVVAEGPLAVSRLVHHHLRPLEGVEAIEVREIAQVQKHRIDLIRIK